MITTMTTTTTVYQTDEDVGHTDETMTMVGTDVEETITMVGTNVDEIITMVGTDVDEIIVIMMMMNEATTDVTTDMTTDDDMTEMTEMTETTDDSDETVNATTTSEMWNVSVVATLGIMQAHAPQEIVLGNDAQPST
jgi:hypothetical protein